MMPRLWSLKADYAVKRYSIPKSPVSEAIDPEENKLDKYEMQDQKNADQDDLKGGDEAKKIENNHDDAKESFTNLEKIDEPPRNMMKPRIVQKTSFAPSCMPSFGSSTREAESISCIVPKDSVIVKEGELMKIGNKTGTMRTRYYILRDHALYIYNNKQQKIPSNVISLRGLYINQIKPDNSINCYGFCISHEQKNVRARVYYHRN